MKIESAVERSMLAARWLLMPLYAILMLILVVFLLKAGQEVAHIFGNVFTEDEAHLVLRVLSLIDMVLVANLLVMVALSGHETFVSPFDTVGEMEKPGWLGKLDPGTVKLKVAASIVAISAIHLLKQYMTTETYDQDRLLTLTAVHLAFVLSALLLAWVDKISSKNH